MVPQISLINRNSPFPRIPSEAGKVARKVRDVCRKGDDEVTPPPSQQTIPVLLLSDNIPDKEIVSLSALSGEHKPGVITDKIYDNLKCTHLDIDKTSERNIGLSANLKRAGSLNLIGTDNRKRLTI